MSASETRKMDRPDSASNAEAFLSRHNATLVMVTGKGVGSEFGLERPEVILGRGPGVDLNFDDTSMSRAHASFEVTGDGFRVRDMASTNGLFLNGTRVQAADLKHGDRIEMGEHAFQFIVEERSSSPNTFVLSD